MGDELDKRENPELSEQPEVANTKAFEISPEQMVIRGKTIIAINHPAIIRDLSRAIEFGHSQLFNTAYGRMIEVLRQLFERLHRDPDDLENIATSLAKELVVKDLTERIVNRVMFDLSFGKIDRSLSSATVELLGLEGTLTKQQLFDLAASETGRFEAEYLRGWLEGKIEKQIKERIDRKHSLLY